MFVVKLLAINHVLVKHLQLLGIYGGRGPDGIGVVGNLQILPELLDILLVGLDILGLILELFLENSQAVGCKRPAGFNAVVLISLGDGVGQICGFLFVVAINGYGNQLGVFNGRELHALLENFHRLRGLECFPVEILFTPLRIQVERRNDVAQHDLRLHDFECGLNEIRVIATEGSGLTAINAGNVGYVIFHLDAGSAGVGFRKDKGNRCGNDGLPDANHPPVIQEMELGFGRGGIF